MKMIEYLEDLLSKKNQPSNSLVILWFNLLPKLILDEVDVGNNIGVHITNNGEA